MERRFGGAENDGVDSYPANTLATVEMAHFGEVALNWQHREGHTNTDSILHASQLLGIHLCG
jgi:hypothetical protein